MSLKRILIIACFSAVLVVGGLSASAAFAQDATPISSGLQAVGNTIALPDTDPRIIASRIINVFLGILAILFLVIIVYAGFLYMTSGGDAAKTETAIKWIRNGIIGLIIILLSWALARYIIEKLIEAAGGTGGGGTQDGGGGGGGGGFTPGGSSTIMRVVSISPSGSIDNRKVVVKIAFSLPLSDASANAADAIILERADGTRVEGTISRDGTSRLFFTPSTRCPAPNEDRFCLDASTDFRVRANESVITARDGQTLRCGGFNPPCEGSFRSGTVVDTTPPSVSMVTPLDGSAVPADSLVDLTARASDDTAIGLVSFSVNGEEVGDDGPQGSSPSSYTAHVRWDTVGIPPGETREIRATAFDTDTGRTDSAPITVRVRAAHCFNGTQDGGETGVDCGGDRNTAEYCGACSGDACTVNADCASGVCANGRCVEQPIITGVTPNDGAVGSLITISGYNFGTSGEVFFLGSGTPVRAIPPPACVEAGTWQWGARQVVVEVPKGAMSGPLRVTNFGSGLSDDTNTPAEGALPDFIVNDTRRPGLCAIRPSGGAPSTVFSLYGTGFGNSSGLVNFGNQSLTPAAWSEQRVESSYPNVAEGPYDVTVNVQGVVSNPVTAEVYPASGGGTPEIVEISPQSGPHLEYVTITGRNFGNTVGTVFFQEVASGNTYPADTNFPPACRTSFWHDTSIIVKVPELREPGYRIPFGVYRVYVRTARPNAPESNRVDFLIVNGIPSPGICAISPRIAPIGTNVTISGERLQASGNVVYSRNIVGTTSQWANAQIISRIPAGAETGPVRANVHIGRGFTTSTNSILLEVRNCNEAPNVCAQDEACCSDGACHAPDCSGGTCTPAVCSEGPTPGVYAWQFSTGLIPRAPRVVVQCGQADLPSPTPWSGRSGGDAACVNADIGILFSTRLDPSTVTDQTVHVYECTGSGSNPCGQRNEIGKTIRPITPADGASGEGRDYVTIRPNALQPSRTYEVVLATNIRGLGDAGTTMDEDTRCGSGNAYCFQFRTRDDAAPCAVATVLVSPHPFTAHEQNERIAYAAVPRPSDVCQIMACEPYDWRWSVSEARASITNTRTNGRGACTQTATALMETVPGSPIQVQATEAGSNIVGTGDLSITFLRPEVSAYGPNCDEACVNALIWATFNIPIDPLTLAENVEVRECLHEDCRTYGATLAINPAYIRLTTAPGTSDTRARQLVITPRGGSPERNLLQPGRFYRVVLRGGPSGIRSLSSAPLAGTNSAEGFTWTFTTRSGDGAVCVAERIDVTPLEKYATRIRERQLFTATAFSRADSCSASGQPIILENGYAWASSRPEVATITQLDTGAQLPAGCRANCTLMGADGVFGETARCGNGAIETTDPAYCATYRARGGTQTCTTLSANGTGAEECDGDAGCNSACLWDPVASFTCSGNLTAVQCMAQAGMGSCGNGRVDRAEDCDPGRICTGTLPSSATPPGSDCTDPARAAECAANNGTCAVATARGCSNGCRNFGASAGGVTCGNNDVSDGEDCDDGNRAAGDGCSPDCIHEGSRSTIRALCGNGIIEPGEACEGGSKCDSRTCLRLGNPVCTSSVRLACCGNGLVESGEDCDDRNGVSGDGCSSACLHEGSSVTNRLTPSYCGDGIRSVIDEAAACEQPPSGPDGRVDAVQLATIIGNAEPDADGRMSSRISATLEGVTGNATYGLQCGFTSETSCTDQDGASYGLTTAGCCSERPTITDAYPPSNDTDVCRNVLVSGSFNVEMDEPSLSNNFVIAKRVSSGSCPQGETPLAAVEPTPKGIVGFFARLWQKVLAFFGAPARAQVAVWCTGSVTGTLNFMKGERDVNGVAVPYTSFAFTLDHALESDTTYVVRFAGDPNMADNADPARRTGIKTKRGVVSPNDFEWTFTTGREICLLNEVQVKDGNEASSFLYTRANEAHPFTAYARSVRNGRVVPISSTASYGWEWEEWTVSNANIATFSPETGPQPASRLSSDARSVISTTMSGSAYVTARVHIIRDEMQTPSTVGRVIAGTEKITALICENPWPSRLAAPFADELDSPVLAGTIFENGPYYNFATMYCRDAGTPGPNEDLPALLINPVPSNPTQVQQGILREYLLTFGGGEQARDGIGIRVMENPRHYGIMDWYRAKGFSGNPAPLTVDGYPALRDGRTVYISAVSTNGPGSPLYSNVYVISYNDGATAVTRQIFDALIQSLTFNTNLTRDISGACENASGNVVIGNERKPVSCTADWECDAYGGDLRCANFKAKIQRDLVRISDFQAMSRALEAARTRDGRYPVLSSGSYLAGFTTSLWPSWSDTLQKSIAPESGIIPKDPVNRFVTCGRCSESGTACTIDSDCPRDNEQCTAVDGYDPKTCWNEQTRAYMCPMNGTVPSSHLFTYSAVDQGARYELAAEFEVPPPDSGNPAVNWWSPPLFEEVRQCVTGEVGRMCLSDADCRACPLGVCTNVPVVTGSCRAVGGRYRYADLCSGQAQGESSTCGDGIVDTNPANMKCLNGTRDGQSCQTDANCPGGTCEFSEICETSGPSAVRTATCTTTDGQAGSRQQVCLACRQYVDDISHPGCFAAAQCGNGRIDGYCDADLSVACGTTQQCRDRYAGELQEALRTLGYNITATGAYDAQTSAAVRAFQAAERIMVDGIAGPQTIGRLKTVLQARGLGCADPNACFTGYAGYRCVTSETCDDGNLNGTYGHCDTRCSGYAGYCGDGMRSLGETCDNGFSGTRANGAYCSIAGGCSIDQSCNLSCSGPAPYCGDGRTDAPTEACDGAGRSTEKAICSDGVTPCSTDADCPGRAQGSCGANNLPACPLTRVCNAGSYAAGRICDSDADCSGGRCGLNQVQTVRTLSCEPAGYVRECQYNVKWGDCSGEQYCGNGTVDQGEECDDGNTDDLDGCTSVCRFNVCGDGSLNPGVEECDLGTRNGEPCTSAEYGSTCANCSNSCKFQLTQGGFCGNGIIESRSAEQCDEAGDLTSYVFAGVSNPQSCRALGYDYAKAPCPSGMSCASDYITCSSSCSYSGCAMCGDPPAAGADLSMYNGRIEGELYDTLFQQPVQDARVTLFYRGLQVQVTNSDENGLFSFEGLDRHTGCNQYKLVIDSYGDNPRTSLFDEATRGGYMPVETPSFAPQANVRTRVSGEFTDIVIDWGQETRRTSESSPNGYVIPRFNLLPKLKVNEYIVQYWWDPVPGEADGGIQRMLDAYAADPEGTVSDMFSQYHDLMVRQPFTYVPGTFGRCSLPFRPETFSNSRGDLCNDRVDDVFTNRLTDACRSVDVNPSETDLIRQFEFLGTGMARCTNKIRATSGRTCVIDGRSTDIPCTDRWDCRDILWGGYGVGGACEETPEQSRSGPLQVLEGAEGSYLFCFHPEYTNESDRQNSDCRNFIIPPQSVFISGKGGQYDIIISQFDNTQYSQRIADWLSEHHAKIVLYDVNGFYKLWDFAEAFAAYSNRYQPPEAEGSAFCPNGTVDAGLYGTAEDIANFSGPYPSGTDRTRIDWTYQMSIAGWYNQYWVPISIDTTDRVVNEWDPSFQSPGTRSDAAGYHLAAMRYFADTYSRRMVGISEAGSGTCWYNTNRENLAGGRTLPANTYICNDNNGQYTGSVNRPACDEATRAMCEANFPGTTCATTVNSTVRCVQTCATNATDCEGTVRGSSGYTTINAFCGGRRSGSSSSVGGER